MTNESKALQTWALWLTRKDARAGLERAYGLTLKEIMHDLEPYGDPIVKDETNVEEKLQKFLISEADLEVVGLFLLLMFVVGEFDYKLCGSAFSRSEAISD